jgi:tetratricopeptide (TPR) repeat protein
MRLFFAVLLTATFALADDWTGKSIKPKEAVKLGRKLGNGIVRDGAEVDTKKTYAVKSDDGTLLELADGYIFKFEAELSKEPDLPKVKAKETDPIKDKGEWFGKKVLPRRDPRTLRMGDWDGDKQIFWRPKNFLNFIVREDKDGFLRVHDMEREGWIAKSELVSEEDAPAWWDKAVKLAPNDSFVWSMRAEGWLKKGETENAIKDYTEAIRLNPQSGYYNNRCVAYRSLKEYDKAISDATEAIRLSADDPYPYSNRGECWYHKEEYKKALADEDEAIRLWPKFTHAYWRRAMIQIGLKEYDKAIDDCTSAIMIDKNYATAYYYRGNAWLLKKQYENAVLDYSEVFRLQPKSEWSVNRLAWIHATCLDAKVRDGKKAVEYGKKLLLLDDRFYGYHDTLAAAYAEAGDFELAVKTQQKAIEMLKADKSADKDDLKKAEARLQLYRDKKPYRDE